MGDIRRVPAVLILPCSYACIACDLLALIAEKPLLEPVFNLWIDRCLQVSLRCPRPPSLEATALQKSQVVFSEVFRFASAQSAVEPFQE